MRLWKSTVWMIVLIIGFESFCWMIIVRWGLFFSLPLHLQTVDLKVIQNFLLKDNIGSNFNKKRNFFYLNYRNINVFFAGFGEEYCQQLGGFLKDKRIWRLFDDVIWSDLFHYANFAPQREITRWEARANICGETDHWLAKFYSLWVLCDKWFSLKHSCPVVIFKMIHGIYFRRIIRGLSPVFVNDDVTLPLL